jgi:hypothetical protein
VTILLLITDDSIIAGEADEPPPHPAINVIITRTSVICFFIKFNKD